MEGFYSNEDLNASTKTFNKQIVSNTYTMFKENTQHWLALGYELSFR